MTNMPYFQPDNIYDFVVVGGGPAGIMASLLAGDQGLRVLILEKEAGVLKKLAATGNGRCNIGNMKPSADHYRSALGSNRIRQRYLQTALKAFSPTDLMAYFDDLGLPLYEENRGRLYPICEQAKTVADLLAKRLELAGVEVQCGVTCQKVIRANDLYLAEASLASGQALRFYGRQLLIAAGSSAYPSLGGGRSGYDLAKSLGLDITELRPGLVPLKLDLNRLALPQTRSYCWLKSNSKGLAGNRFQGEGRFYLDKECLAETRGEFLFNKQGVSGIAAMELGQYYDPKSQQGQMLEVDFLPQIRLEDLADKLGHKFKAYRLTGEERAWLFRGYVKRAIADYLAQALDGLTGRQTGRDLDLIGSAARLLKQARWEVTGILNPQFAQVTVGGVSLPQVQAHDLSVKGWPGLYLAGEILDVAGDSGGYNLQWAWSSGYLVGQSVLNYHNKRIL